MIQYIKDNYKYALFIISVIALIIIRVLEQKYGKCTPSMNQICCKNNTYCSYATQHNDELIQELISKQK